jgi:hypothetical protein
MALEFIERLDDYEGDDRWLVQRPGSAAPRVAWMRCGDHDNPDWLPRVEAATRPLHGPIHPRISAIFSSTWYGERLVFEVEDDRGPTLEAAATQLADPTERERWAVAQVIAIADGLAALRARDPVYVYEKIEPYRLFVDEAGHTRLRAPIAYVARPPSTSAGPGPGFEAARFLSPEQVRDTGFTAASNVFSLAANLYLALSGRRPFEDGNESVMSELAGIILREPAPIATHAPGLGRVLDRAFVKDPAARIPDPRTFADELRRCVPDAADYDAVISDRIVAWRATRPLVVDRMWADVKCRLRWDELAPASNEVRHCTRCDLLVVRARAGVAPFMRGACRDQRRDL